MAEVLKAGQPVRVVQCDVAVHTRAPRYVRGRTGRIIEDHGTHPLPDSVVAGERPPRTGTVWAVAFHARELFGTGDHTVTVNLWEQYLEPVAQDRS
jgi:hypothetical protein